MLYRTIMSAACTALLAGAPFAQAQDDLPDFPTAAAPPPGDAFPAQEVEFPNGVIATADVTYDTQVGYRPLTLDIYRQPDSEEARPLVLYFHGGGWERSHKRAAGVFTDFPGVLADLAVNGGAKPGQWASRDRLSVCGGVKDGGSVVVRGRGSLRSRSCRFMMASGS